MSARRHARDVLPLAAAALLALSGCDSDSDPAAAGAQAAPAPAASTPGAESAASTGVRVVSAADGLRLAARADAVVIDVRTPEEFADGHLDGARNVPLADGFADAVQALPRDASYVLYCRSGNRSAQAAEIMAGLGFADVADAGGLDALAAAGGRVVT